jgi:hypothetical protein
MSVGIKFLRLQIITIALTVLRLQANAYLQVYLYDKHASDVYFLPAYSPINQSFHIVILLAMSGLP